MSSFQYASNITTKSNARSNSNGSIILGVYGNAQKPITSNETDLIISKGLSYTLSQKTRIKKVLELKRNVSKTYIHPNRKVMSKDLPDVIHEHNTKRNSFMIKKESGIFGSSFLGYGATISIYPLLNILSSGGNIPVSVL